MKTITATCLIALAGATFSQAVPLDQKAKSEFISYYRQYVKLAEEFPNKPKVQAMFVDLDGDGMEEAFATSQGNFYEVGWLWTAFRKVGEEWKAIDGYKPDGSLNLAASIFARPGEVFGVSLNDGSKEFLILGENFDKLAPGGLGPLKKLRFSLDTKANLQQTEISDIERYLAYGGPNHTGLIKRLEVIPVEVFDHQAAEK